MGHQGRDASRDIRVTNALPVIDGEAFEAYVEQVLIPELTPGTVVILDNLATHKNAAAAKATRKLLILANTLVKEDREWIEIRA